MAVTINQGYPANGAAAMWYLIDGLLASGGWVVTGSNDGSGNKIGNSGSTVYNTQFTQANFLAGNSGTGYFNNAGAVILLAFTGGVGVNTRQLMIQRGNIDAFGARIAYTYTGGWVMPTGGIAGCPAFTGSFAPPSDTQFLVGSNVAGSTGLPFPNNTTPLTFKTYAFVGDSSYNYAFYIIHQNANITYASYGARVVGFMDVLQPGTYPAADVEPYLWNWGVSSTGANLFDFGSLTNLTSFAPFSWYKKGLAGETWARTGLYGFPAGAAGGTTTISNPYNINPYNYKDDLSIMEYARPGSSTQPGRRGISTLFRMPSTVRMAYTGYTVNNPNDYIALNDVAAVWSGSITV